MPMYAFKCPDCEAELEKEMTIKTYQYSQAQKCPQCDATMHRDYTGVHSRVVGSRKPRSKDIEADRRAGR